MAIPKKMHLIEWEDARVLDDSHWVGVTETSTYTPLIMKTLGYLLYDGPEGVIVTSTISDNCFATRDQIPRGMIRSIIELELPVPVKPVKK